MREMKLSELSAAELREIDGGVYPQYYTNPVTGQVEMIGCTESPPAGWEPARDFSRS